MMHHFIMVPWCITSSRCHDETLQDAAMVSQFMKMPWWVTFWVCHYHGDKHLSTVRFQICFTAFTFRFVHSIGNNINKVCKSHIDNKCLQTQHNRFLFYHHVHVKETAGVWTMQTSHPSHWRWWLQRETAVVIYGGCCPLQSSRVVSENTVS